MGDEAGVPFGQRLDGGQDVLADLAAQLADVAQQRLAVGRKAAAEPIVLAAPLQQPLQRVVGDAPVGIELDR